jgi:hypothetical protein
VSLEAASAPAPRLKAISGAANTTEEQRGWDAGFERCVLSRRGIDRIPKRGSIGVQHNVKRMNLANELYEKCSGDFEEFEAALPADLNAFKKQQLVDFMKLCEKKRGKYFIIKRGTQPYLLVRRIGHYRYDPTEHFCHRISYEVIKDLRHLERMPFAIPTMVESPWTLSELLE